MSARPLFVAATFTAEPLREPLRGWFDLLELNIDPHFAPYSQVFQQLLDQNSGLSNPANVAAALLIRVADWLADRQSELTDDQRLIRHAEEFIGALDSYLARSSYPLTVVLCPSFGVPTSMQSALAATEAWLTEQLGSRDRIELISHQQIAALYPVELPTDEIALRVAHIPYSQQYFTALASMLCRQLHRQLRPPVKALVLDCDNTLWDGVCGEIGPNGVQVSAPRAQLQRKLLQLRDSGVLLCLCSKNHADDVWAVFGQNSGMQLSQADITASRINWQSKSSNLRSLASELNLGLDSLVFLDDNPLECAEVRQNCPETQVLELPHRDLEQFIDHSWVLDPSRATAEDRQRAERYRDELQRQQTRRAAATLDQFLAQLELVVEIAQAQVQDLERVAQLTQRTNQFNFTTIRRDEPELRRLIQDGQHRCLVVRARDKFGDYGLVGAMIYRLSDGLVTVDTLLLSCRALGRQIELSMLEKLIEHAQSERAAQLELRLVQTTKNQPAQTFYQAVCGDFHSAGSTWQCRLRLDQWRQRIDQTRTLESQSVSSDQSSTATSVPVALPVSQSSEIICRIASHSGRVADLEKLIATKPRQRPELSESFLAPATALQRQVVEICRQVLNLDRLGLDDPLKSLGISSLGIVQVLSQIHRELGVELSITNLFSLPTAYAISQRILEIQNQLADGNSKQRTDRACRDSDGLSYSAKDNAIAVIGLSGRFPGAPDVATFWKNLAAGVCSIVDISDDQLNLPGSSPLRDNPNLVKRAATLADADQFDARFFGIFPKEAQMMDPQHRIMIECCWHALEDAGYAPDDMPDSVGLFAGCYMDTYILASLISNPALIHSLANSFHGGDLHCELGNDKDYLATRVSYLLNLRGPAITVQTACSTSLVAIAQACQSLVARQCDVALAGGVTLKLPQNRGYLYAEGGMVSPDGTVRTFDAKARGTVFGEGAGVVALKRLQDALADGDDIYAVIRGWGLNNDGRAKMGYTAPSVEGQSEAILAAHRMADISADTISYVEAHGTGTALGDPIEIDSLSRAFRQSTDKKQFCAIGSLKTNVGHLDVAAGVTGLIKVCLALRHQQIPPSLNFEQPNPNIDFPNTPFVVNTALRPWERGPQVRRAGLSSFGVGGTNAHVVIEEPPQVSALHSRRPFCLIPVSARSSSALGTLCMQLADQLETQADLHLDDVAYTLQTGRKKFNYTRAIVAADRRQAVEQLRLTAADGTTIKHQVRRDVPCIWLFPGQGSQFPNMGRQLYESEPVFAAALDRCAELLRQHADFDLRERLFTADDRASIERCQAELRNTELAQPAIFSVSYAYACWLMECGVKPQCMLGHSVGEFVAATIAGVFSLADALRLVAFRARFMQQLPPGRMLAVRADANQVNQVTVASGLADQLAVAAINSPQLCVMSGPDEAIEALQQRLESAEIGCMPLHTSHAFHSAMMDPAVEPMLKELQQLKLSPPSIPIISSVTGVRLTDALACDPLYWAKHLRETVRFSDAVGQALQVSPAALLEVGPGQTLSTLTRQQPNCNEDHVVLAVSPHAKQTGSAAEHVWTVVGRLWQESVSLNFTDIYSHEQRRRVHLPVYPFERQRYWFDQLTDTSICSTATDISSNSVSQSADTEWLEQLDQQDAMLQRIIQQQILVMEEQLKSWSCR